MYGRALPFSTSPHTPQNASKASSRVWSIRERRGIKEKKVHIDGNQVRLLGWRKPAAILQIRRSGEREGKWKGGGTGKRGRRGRGIRVRKGSRNEGE